MTGKDKRVLKRFRNAVFEKLPRKEQRKLWKRIEVSAGSISGMRSTVFYTIFKVAASIAILFTLGYLANNLMRENDNISVKQIVVETYSMERTRLVLPDSSIVWLNAGSRIEYPEKFNSEERNIKLSGEAYFDVSREEERKFIVKTGDIAVNVLGTQFIVIDYPNEKQAEVVLVSGKVHVNEADMKNSEFKLSPGERFTLNKMTGKRIIEKINTLSYTNWTEGKISFENVELKHIIKNLERWYGVSIICPENIGTRYNLTFTLRNEDLETTMQMMSDIAPIRFEKTAEGIIVVKN